MKKILVPTDFSQNAKGAFLYAYLLAHRWDEALIKLVNVYIPAGSTEYAMIVPIEEDLRIREQRLEEFLAESMAELELPKNEQKKITVETDILIGFPVEEIAKQSKEYDIVVMGTTGEGGVLEQVFGSVSTGLSQKAHCPVLLVPKDAEFKNIDRIMYASCEESACEDTIEQIVDFNKIFNASLHFIHVKEQNDRNFETTKEEIMEELFEEGEPKFAFDITEVDGKTVKEGLHKYATGNDMDLVVMVTKHRNFWKQLFHKSQTKQMLLTTKIPTLVFHSDD